MDSAPQTGLEIKLTGILIVDVSCCTDDEICVNDDFQLRKSGMFSLVQSQSSVLQQIEDERRIQLVKRIQKSD